MVSQSLVPSSWPARAASSSRVVKTRMTVEGSASARLPTRDRGAAGPKVLLHDHLDGGLRPADDPRARRRRAATSCPRHDDADGARPLVRRGRRLRLAGALPRDVRPHRRGDADRGRAHPGRPRVRARTSPPTAWSTPRSATPPSSTSRQGLTLDEVVAAVQDGLRRGRRRPPGGRIVVRQLLTAMRHAGPLDARSPSWPSPGATGASPASTSPARRRATRRPGTSTRSSTSSGRTPTSPSTPARRSGCRRSGRRSSGAAPTGSATASGSSTTSRSTTTARSSSAGWRRTSATSGSRSRCARASNVQTGAADSIAEHPIGLLTELRFRVTVNTDNRLMSGTSMTGEMWRAGRGVRLRRSRTCGGSRSTR